MLFQVKYYIENYLSQVASQRPKKLKKAFTKPTVKAADQSPRTLL